MIMENEQKFYVYVDYREDSGEPFYVGKGLWARTQFLKRNKLHTNIRNKHGMIRKIVFETTDESEAFEKEVQLIQELGTFAEDGIGANYTLGGEGTSGYKNRFTEEHKKNHLHAIQKFFEDPENRKKYSEKWKNPEYREMMCKARKKVWENPDHKEKVSKSIKEHHSDPEFRKKQGEKMREVLNDPEIKEKISRRTKEKLNNPEIKKKIREGVKRAFLETPPEVRSERVRKSWETRRLKKLQQTE